MAVDKQSPTPTVEPLPSHDDIDPVVLANLAIQIMRLKGGNAPTVATTPVRFNDSGLHDSLDDARRLLLAAKGLIDEDVHAYRLFSADDGLMSYNDIAKRLRKHNWHLVTSRNKIEDIILELVDLAEKAVQKEIERYEVLNSVRYGYPGGVYGLLDLVKGRIRDILWESEFEQLFPNPDLVADLMGDFFLHLMEKNITGDWEQHFDEEFASMAGIHSFIKYVCGGMTYEQFNPKGKNAKLTPKRLGCLLFFLNSADAWSASDLKARAKDLDLLMKFVRGNVPPLIVDHLENCLEVLRKPAAQVKSVNVAVNTARQELKTFCERDYLAKVVQVQEWNLLIDQLGMLSRDPGLSLPLPAEAIENLCNLMKQVKESTLNANFEPDVIRAQLHEIHEKLTEHSPRLHENIAQFIAEKMDNAAAVLGRALRMEHRTTMDCGQTLEELLSDLKGRAGTRKCRPYELFLFAAQNGHCRGNLVRKRSSLVEGLVPGPPHSSSLSILTSHRGARIAMGYAEVE